MKPLKLYKRSFALQSFTIIHHYTKKEELLQSFPILIRWYDVLSLPRANHPGICLDNPQNVWPHNAV